MHLMAYRVRHHTAPHRTTPRTPGSIFHGRYLDTSTVGILTAVGIVSVPTSSALETLRRELAEDVSFGIGTLLLVEQSILEGV